MVIQIEPKMDVPIYAQIRNQVMEGIARGDLQAGNVLPSVRALAADLGVNMHTVNKSYHELESKGIIRIVPKSGAVICSQTDSLLSHHRIEQLSQELRPILVESLVIGMKENQIVDLVKSITSTIKEG